MIAGYHAHVYFTSKSRASAATLREKIRSSWAGVVRVHDLIDIPIGPHPLPMFEVDIPPASIEPLKDWLTVHNNDHSILIHPLTGDDLADHRDHPEWVGQPQPLNLSFLIRTKKEK